MTKRTTFRLIAALLACSLSPGLYADDAARYYENARKQVSDKNYEAAIIQLKNALQQNPEHLPSRILMGQTMIHAGDAVTAEKYLKSALTGGASEEEVITLLGSAYLMQGKNQELLDSIRSGSRSTLVESQILILRGQAYLELGRMDEATDSFQRARRLTPRNPVPILGLATTDMRLGRLSRAQQLVDEAERYSDDRAGILYAKGELQRLMGNTEAAIDLFSQCLEIAPNHQQARKNRAVVFLGIGEMERAEADIARLRETSPADLQVIYLSAMLKAREGKYKEAVGELESISQSISGLKADFVETHSPTLLLLGTLEYLQGKYDSAKMHLKRYLNIHPFHLNPRLILAEMLIREHDGLGAIAMLRPIMDSHPDEPDLMLLLGEAYLIERDYQMASDYLEKAVAARPELVSARTQLVLSRIQQGDMESAVQELEQMLQTDSGQSRPGMMLAQLQLRSQDYQAAIATTDRLKSQYPGDPWILNLAGAARLGTGDVEGARKEYQSALRIKGDFVPVLLNLAGLDFQQGQLASARSHYETILESYPGNTHAMAGIARILELQGDQPGAITWLERVRNLDSGPESAQYLLRLAGLYLQQGQPEQTLEITKELERLLPGANRVSELEGLAYLETGDAQNAARRFRIISQSSPESPVLQNRMARLLMRAGDLDGAAEAVGFALGVDPGFLPARETQVMLVSTMGKPEAAMDYALGLQRDHPELALGYRLAGDLSMQSGDAGAAAESYQAAIQREPGISLVLGQFRAEILAGRKERGLSLMESWLAGHPDDARAHQAMASYYTNSNQLELAKQHYEKLAVLRPEDPGILNNLANVCLRTGDRRALVFAQRAQELAPDQPAVNDTLGWILVGLGRSSEGLDLLNRANAREPNQPSIRYHRAVALKALGREQEARRELQGLLAQNGSFEEEPEARALLQQLGAAN